MSIRERLARFALAVCLLAAGGPSAPHARAEPSPSAGSQPPGFAEASPAFDAFARAGPHRALAKHDVTLALRSKERVRADFYYAESLPSAPLVVFVHGYDNSKADHAYQGMHLATWGMHSLVVQVRGRGPWVANGTLIARLVQHLQANPGSLGPRIDPNRIVLAGHSFGATAVVVALSGGAPAAGAVLLDPADAIRGLPGYLRKVRTPVAIVGADERLAVARNRGMFYASLPRAVSEVSITDARHEDAQFSMAVDAAQAEPGQVRFVEALTAAAHSLGYTGKLDQAWIAYRDAARSGVVFGLRRK